MSTGPGGPQAPEPPRLGLAGYRELLRAPGAPRLVLAALFGRIPIGILAIGIVLLIRRDLGSYALAGAVDATFGVATAVGAPIQGRLIDRSGQTRMLLACAAVHVAGLLALVIAAQAGVAGPAFAGAAAAGIAFPPLSPSMRALWPRLLAARPALLPVAYTLEAVLLEVFFITGPLLVGLLTTLASPAAAVLLAAALALGGTLVFASAPASRAWRGERTAAGATRAGALASPGMRTLVALTVPLTLAFGVHGVAVPAFAELHGNRGAAGFLLAAQALGSMIGGLWYGSREHGRTLAQLYVIFCGVLTVGVGLVAIGGGLGTMAGLLVLSGVGFAPLGAVGYQLVARLAPVGTLTEAYTWSVTANVVGVAAGSGLAGVLVSAAGWRTAALAGWGICALGAASAVLRRRTLAAG